MPSCSILGCKNGSRKQNLIHGGISYHRYPKDPCIKEKWIDATARVNWMPGTTSTICSEHFLADDFLISAKGKKYLIPGTCPTLKIYKFFDQPQDCNDAATGSIKKEVDAETLVVKIESEDSEDALDSDTQDSVDTLDSDSQDSTDTVSQKGDGAVFEQPQFVSCGIKETNDENAEAAMDPTKKKTLQGQLRFCENKVKTQKLKIKQLQAVNRRLRKKMSIMNEELIRLKEKNSAAKEVGSDRSKNTNLGNYFQNFS